MAGCDNSVEGLREKTATPIATPRGDVYTEAQIVALSSATQGAIIYYTTNGTTPSASSARYGGPITINTNTRLMAIAVKDGMDNSGVMSEYYAIHFFEETVATPEANPEGGYFNETVIVVLSCPTEDADIFYTIDGTIPNRNSTLYSGEIVITPTTILKAIAVKDGMNDSEIMTEYYGIHFFEETVAKPVADSGGVIYFSGTINVVLSCQTEGADIYYTIDETTPNKDSTLYTGEIIITSTVMLQAIAVKEGMNDSEIITKYYTKDTVIQDFTLLTEAMYQENLGYGYGFESSLIGSYSVSLRSAVLSYSEERIFIPESYDYRIEIPETHEGVPVTRIALSVVSGPLLTLVLPKTIVSIYGNPYLCDEYIVADENPLFISDNGIIYNKDKSELVLYPSGKQDREVVISESVVSIGNAAFRYARYIERITFPQNLRKMGVHAFDTCVKLEAFVLPNPTQLKVIPSVAFLNCPMLGDVTITEGVESIDAEAFSQCNRLRTAYLPSTLRNIPLAGFNDIFFSELNYGINTDADIGILNVKIDAGNSVWKDVDGVVYSKDGTILVFWPVGKKDTRLEIAEGTTEIGYASFWYNRIEYLRIPSTMIEIPHCGGFFPHLKEVVLPETLTTINNSFLDATKLEKINFPASLRIIGHDAFYNTNLSQVHLSADIESIGTAAFSGCPNLISLTVDSQNPNYISIDNVIFTKDMKTVVSYAAGKTDAEYTIPDTVEEIGHSIFGAAKFSRVNVPDSVKSIGQYAFKNCHNLTEISLPAVQTMKEFVFVDLNLTRDYCEKLEVIYIRGLSEDDFDYKDNYLWSGIKNGIEYLWETNWNFKWSLGPTIYNYSVVWGAE
jgi:hypothetical protein